MMVIGRARAHTHTQTQRAQRTSSWRNVVRYPHTCAHAVVAAAAACATCDMSYVTYVAAARDVQLCRASTTGTHMVHEILCSPRRVLILGGPRLPRSTRTRQRCRPARGLVPQARKSRQHITCSHGALRPALPSRAASSACVCMPCCLLHSPAQGARYKQS